MAELGKKLAVFVVGNLVVWGLISGIQNKMDGKDFLGRRKQIKKTKVDWLGNVVLGTADYKVA